jgi:signal transduction histidine kinase
MGKVCIMRRFPVWIFLWEGLRLLLLLVLAGWWSLLLWRQVEVIAALEAQPPQWLAGQRHMILGETVSLAVLLVLSTAVTLWLCLRDARRRRSWQAFMAGMTHELRTPLTSIRLQAEAALEESPAGSPYLQRLLEDVSRLEAQVERTLELARSEGGGAPALQTVKPAAIFQRALTSFPPRQQQRLRVQLDANHPVRADPHWLEVVFRNLLDNSLQHGGAERLEVHLTSAAHRGQVSLTYTDTGAGLTIPVTAAGQLFTKAAASKGAGIGLYLIRMLLRQMGGRAMYGKGERGFAAQLRLPLA